MISTRLDASSFAWACAAQPGINKSQMPQRQHTEATRRRIPRAVLANTIDSRPIRHANAGIIASCVFQDQCTGPTRDIVVSRHLMQICARRVQAFRRLAGPDGPSNRCCAAHFCRQVFDLAKDAATGRPATADRRSRFGDAMEGLPPFSER